MIDIQTRAGRLALEKHRLEVEVYSVDFASGAAPRLSSSETLTSGSVTIVKAFENGTSTDATTEFATGSPIPGTVATGAQASSKLQFTLGAAATGDQDGDAEYYARVTAYTASRTMISLHKLVVFELGDVGAP